MSAKTGELSALDRGGLGIESPPSRVSYVRAASRASRAVRRARQARSETTSSPGEPRLRAENLAEARSLARRDLARYQRLLGLRDQTPSRDDRGALISIDARRTFASRASSATGRRRR